MSDFSINIVVEFSVYSVISLWYRVGPTSALVSLPLSTVTQAGGRLWPFLTWHLLYMCLLCFYFVFMKDGAPLVAEPEATCKRYVEELMVYDFKSSLSEMNLYKWRKREGGGTNLISTYRYL